MKVEGAVTNRIGAVYGGNRPLMANVTITGDIREAIKKIRELEDRLFDGSIDPRDCLSPLQDLLQGKFSSSRQEVERQLARWQEAGVTISQKKRERILQQAQQFVPSTPTDEPLVSGGFGYALKSSVSRLWEAITPPTGYQKERYMDEKIHLRYVPGMKPLRRRAGLRLIHFDSNGYAGLSPEKALVRAKRDGGIRLAGVEVLEKLLVGNGGERRLPILSGIKAKRHSKWDLAPCISRDDDGLHSGPSLILSTISANGRAGSGSSSPVVREC